MTDFVGTGDSDLEEKKAVTDTLGPRANQIGYTWACWMEIGYDSASIEKRSAAIKAIKTTAAGFHLTCHGGAGRAISGSEPIADLRSLRYADASWGGIKFYAESTPLPTSESGWIWSRKSIIVSEEDPRGDCRSLSIGRAMRSGREPMQFVFLDFCDSAGNGFSDLAHETTILTLNETWKIAFRLGAWNNSFVDQSYLLWKGPIGQNNEGGSDQFAYLKMRKSIWSHLGGGTPMYQAYNAVPWQTINFSGHRISTGMPSPRAEYSGIVVGLP